jgi:hypothetical protein
MMWSGFLLTEAFPCAGSNDEDSFYFSKFQSPLGLNEKDKEINDIFPSKDFHVLPPVSSDKVLQQSFSCKDSQW